MPGFNSFLVNEHILRASYVYIEDHALLLEVVQFGVPETKGFVVEFAGHQSKIDYQRCDHGRAIHGLAKLVALDRGLARRVYLPISQICSSCNVSAVTPAHLTSSPLLLHSGLPKHYYLLWQANLSNDGLPDVSEDSCEEATCEDFAGYACTPLTKAYDLFQRLLEQELLADSIGHIDSGVVSRVSHRVCLRNGEVAAAICRNRWDRAIAARERVSFVWDLVDVKADFSALSCILDAAQIPRLKNCSDDEFETIYGISRKLECKELPSRQCIESDWLSSVY